MRKGDGGADSSARNSIAKQGGVRAVDRSDRDKSLESAWVVGTVGRGEGSSDDWRTVGCLFTHLLEELVNLKIEVTTERTGAEEDLLEFALRKDPPPGHGAEQLLGGVLLVSGERVGNRSLMDWGIHRVFWILNRSSARRMFSTECGNVNFSRRNGRASAPISWKAFSMASISRRERFPVNCFSARANQCWTVLPL